MTLSQPDVVHFLNREVIPAWESVGAVPKITIDFGNGHVLRRTLGGNIVMLLILPDGRVVDAYPGVYTAPDLLNEMQASMEMLQQLGMNAPDESYLAWHRRDSDDRSIAERTTLSKAVVQSPVLRALGKKSTTSVDLSKQPIDTQTLRKMLGDDGAEIVKMDSANNVEKVRPAVHRWFAEHQKLPTAMECRDAMYQDILHIPLNDPYLGLAYFAVPGTPTN